VDEADGLAHPSAMDQYLVEWKRPESLLEDTPVVPVVVLRPPPAEGEGEDGAAAAPADADGAPVRDLADEHCLYFGTPCVEWIAFVIRLVYERRDVVETGHLLWENIWPKDPETNVPVPSPTGKYLVRAYVMNAWRVVEVDDRLPVDLFGAALGVGSRPIMCWPALLTKAIFKLMKRYGVEHLESSADAPVYKWLTGWDRESLGVSNENGALFDRLFDAARRNERKALSAVCLRERFVRPPLPRIISLCGPSGVGKTQLLNALAAKFPERFGRCVATTSRAPAAHETEGGEYRFLPRKRFREAIKAGAFLESAVCDDPRLGKSSDEAYHPDDRKADGARFAYGQTFDEIRAVAAGGKVLLAECDLEGSAFLKSHDAFEAFTVRVDAPDDAWLERRLKARAREDESTIQKRLEFARAEWELAVPGFAEAETAETAAEAPAEAPAVSEKYHAVLLEDDADALFYQFKVRCAELSPVVRNRLLGLPSYILDYSDVIPANETETPKIKPVAVVGPNFLEKSDCVRRVAREFPEVFAFPQIVTTEPARAKFPSEDDPEEEEEAEAEGTGADAEAAEAADSNDAADSNASAASAAASAAVPGRPGHPWSAIAMEHLTPEAFEAASGEYACVWETQFAHAEVTYKYGITKASLEKAASDERLALVNLPSVEALDAFVAFCAANETAVAPAGGPPMTLFLGPATFDEHETRLRRWLTESDASVASAVAAARAERDAGFARGAFDAELVVADAHDAPSFDDTLARLCELVSAKRPDIIPPVDEAAEAKKVCRPLVLCGPAEGGKKALLERLTAEFPERFARVTTTTTRPPEEGEQASAEEGAEREARYHFVSKEQFDADLAEDKFLEHVERAAFVPAEGEEDAGGGDEEETAEETAAPDASTETPEPFLYGVSREAFEAAREGGRIPVLDVDAAGVRALKKQFPEGAFLCVVPADVEALERKLRARADAAAAAEGADAAAEAEAPPADAAAEDGGEEEVDAEAAEAAARAEAETAAAEAAALELRVASGIEKIAREMEGFAEDGLFTDAVVVDENEEDGFSAASEASALEAAYGDMQTSIRNSPLGYSCAAFLRPPPRPLVVAGPLGSRRERTFERLLEEFPEAFGFPIGATTREPRDGETHGVHYDFIDRETFETRANVGEFLECTEVIVGYGEWDEATQSNPPITHAYGTSTREVKRVAAEGKMPVIETDVAGARAMKEAGLDAVYVFFAHPEGFEGAEKTHIANLKHAGEPLETIDQRVSEARAELDAARSKTNVFDAVLAYDADEDARLARLKERIALVEPRVVPMASVWGFGRARYDVSARVYGYRPTRVAVLGPAACGKSTAARALAARYGAPLIYPGALLRAAAYDQPTALGAEARRYLDSTRVVPDDFMMKLVLERVRQEDCRRRGWVMDGFPHNHYQARELEAAGVVADKVLVLETDVASALVRTAGRLIDPVTGRTYHSQFAPPSPDEPEVAARLVPRHDDEEANVRNRLAKYDFSDVPVRAVFPHVSLSLDATRAPAAVLADACAFCELEDALHDTRVITDVASLPCLEYEIAELGKYRRVSVARLDAPGMVGDAREAPVWVDLASLERVARAFTLNVDPAFFEHAGVDERLDLSAIGPGGNASALGKMVHVDSEEPVDLQIALTLAPREPTPPAEKPNVLALCGDGAEALAAALAAAYPDVYAVAEAQELPPQSAKTEAVSENGDDDVTAEGHEGASSEDPDDEGAEEARSTTKAASETEGDSLSGFVSEAFRGANRAAATARLGLCPVVWLDAAEAAAFRAAAAAAGPLEGADGTDGGPETSQNESEGAAAAESEGDDAASSAARNRPVVVCVGMPPPQVSSPSSSSEPTAEGDEAPDGEAAGDADGAEISASPAGVFDAVIYPPSTETGSALLSTLEQLKGVPAVASRLQARRAAAAEGDDVCSLVVHDYDWHATGAPQRILGSLETSTHASVLLRLPRGRHVLQLTVDPGFYFHATARASSPFDFDEPAALLREKNLAAPAVCEGAYGAIDAGDFVVWFRRVFTVAEPKTLVSLCLEVGDPKASPFARFAVVNNDLNGEVRHFVAGAAPPSAFEPNERGYTLLAYAKTLVPLEKGAWRLSALSDAPLASFDTEEPPGVGPEDKAIFTGTYAPNYALSVCRFRVAARKRCLLSFHLECSTACGFKATLVRPEQGWETKQAEYLRGGHQGHLHGQELERWNAYAALTVPAVALEATTDYVVFEVKLAPERCAFPVEANGDVPAPIAWKLTTYSTEQADTTWTPDDARARYFETTVAGWNAKDAERAAAAEAALAARRAERAARARGEDPAPLLKAVKVGKDAEVGEDAEQVALDPAEMRRTLRRGGATVDAARAAAAEKAAAGLGLTLKDAKDANEPTARRLSAFESLRRTAKALPRAEDLVETALITAEAYESRETALRSSIEESKARLAAFVARREAARESRGALAETKKTSFAEWRAKETLARREDPTAAWREKRAAYLRSVQPERAERVGEDAENQPEAAEE